MNKISLGIFFLLLLCLTAFFFISHKPKNFSPEVNNRASSPSSNSSPSVQTDYTATFAIFTNGTFRIFSDSKYHNQSAEVFIDGSNPNIIMVKKPGVTWGDFFKTLPMKLEESCLTTGTGQVFCSNESQKLTFYINGERVDNFLSQEINPNDKALIRYGSENQNQLESELKRLDTIL